MTGIITRGGVRESSISAVITRADGTREDLGVIAYHHRNPFKRFIWRLKRLIHG